MLRESQPFTKAQKLYLAALGIYILSFAFETLVETKIFGNNVLLPEICFLGVSVAFLIGFWRDLPRFFRGFAFSKLHNLDKALILYAVVQTLSFSVNGHKRALGEVLALGYFLALYAQIRWVFQENVSAYFRVLRLFLMVSVLVSSLFALFFYAYSSATDSIYHVWLYKNYPGLGTTYRATGFWRNPSFFAEFLLLGLSLAIFSWSEFNKSLNKNLKNWLLMPTLVVGFLAFFATKDKLLLISGSFLCLFFAHFIFLKSTLLRRVVQIVGVSGILFYVFFAHFLVFQYKQNATFGVSEFNSSFRIGSNVFQIQSTPYYNLKKLAVQVFLEKPILGVGGNNLLTHARSNWTQYNIVGDTASAPHSTYFGALADLGILGFSAVLFLFLTLWRTASSVFEGREKRLWQFYLAAIFTVALCHDVLNVRQFWLVFSYFSLVLLQKSANLTYEN
jgi:hypothetical protein